MLQWLATWRGRWKRLRLEADLRREYGEQPSYSPEQIRFVEKNRFRKRGWLDSVEDPGGEAEAPESRD